MMLDYWIVLLPMFPWILASSFRLKMVNSFLMLKLIEDWESTISYHYTSRHMLCCSKAMTIFFNSSRSPSQSCTKSSSLSQRNHRPSYILPRWWWLSGQSIVWFRLVIMSRFSTLYLRVLHLHWQLFGVLEIEESKCLFSFIRWGWISLYGLHY